MLARVEKAGVCWFRGAAGVLVYLVNEAKSRYLSSGRARKARVLERGAAGFSLEGTFKGAGIS